MKFGTRLGTSALLQSILSYLHKNKHVNNINQILKRQLKGKLELRLALCNSVLFTIPRFILLPGWVTLQVTKKGI